MEVKRDWGTSENKFVEEAGGTTGIYRVSRHLGKGLSAVVKLAVHVPTGRKVAIKLIKKNQIDAKYKQRIYREVQIMRLLQHPNIVELFHIFESPTSLFLVMEYAPRGDLHDFLIRNGRMSEINARKFFRQIVSAVHYCHSKFVVHRDLKLENILLDKNLKIKIADFGLSCIYNPSGTLKTYCGTVAYAAPELLKGCQYIGPEIDVWSIGVILYSLVVGKLPFTGTTPRDVSEKILCGQFEVPFYMSYICASLLRACLKLEPTERCQLPSIMEDMWTNLGCEKLNPYKDKDEPIELDTARVQQMVTMGYNEPEIESSIKNQRYDDIYCSYQLLGFPGEKAKNYQKPKAKP